jgi:hypothetical protein
MKQTIEKWKEELEKNPPRSITPTFHPDGRKTLKIDYSDVDEDIIDEVFEIAFDIWRKTWGGM